MTEQPSSVNTQVKAAVETVIASDPQMQQYMRGLLKLSMQTLVTAMTRGPLESRIAAAKPLVALAATSLARQEGDDGVEALRAEMHEMVAEMREHSWAPRAVEQPVGDEAEIVPFKPRDPA